jgi:predicted DCC family thiol-disulfide oxidoreductase YuxK
VRFALNMDSHAKLRFAALQSNTGRQLLQRCGRRPDDITSIVLVEEDRCSIKSEAILRIARLLEQPFPVVAALLFPLPGMVRDAFYDQVRSHCAWFSPPCKQKVLAMAHSVMLLHADRFSRLPL